MENRWAITSWSKNHWLPGVTVLSCLVELIFFDQASSLSDDLWVLLELVQMACGILSLGDLSNFIARKNCAYFHRFVPNYQGFTLFWSLIFWFFYAFTRHWLIGAILSWQYKRHFVILFQNIIIGSSYSICGISWSSHRLHAWLILDGTPWLFLIANDPLRFRWLHLFALAIYKLL